MTTDLPFDAADSVSSIDRGFFGTVFTNDPFGDYIFRARRGIGPLAPNATLTLGPDFRHWGIIAPLHRYAKYIITPWGGVAAPH